MAPETVLDHIGRIEPLTEIAVGRVAQISHIARGHRDDGGIALEGLTYGPYQREIALIGTREDQPMVAVLEHIDIVRLEQTPDDNLAHPARAEHGWSHSQDRLGDRRRPGATGIGERPRRDHAAMAAIDYRQPPDVEPVGANAARTSADIGAPLGRIDRIGDHQP